MPYSRAWYTRNKATIVKAGKRWVKKNRERVNANRRRNYWKNRQRELAKMRKYYRRYHTALKMAVLTHYGGNPPKCACCGEGHIEFLSVDHMSGDGKEDRAKHGTSGFYRRLVRSNFPPGFQILCLNCNFAKGHFRHCPHDRE